MDFVQWLTAQLDADEQTARAATKGPWRAHDTHLGQYGYAATILSGEGNDTDLRAWLPSMSNEPWDEKRNVWADAEFIAEHDPARVLREVDGKRQLLALHSPSDMGSFVLGDDEDDDSPACRTCGDLTVQFPCWTLRLLASVYAGRDGYQEGWAP